MANRFLEYQLTLKKETQGAYIFTIPESGNDVMIPKSQCAILVYSENEPIIEDELYTVEIADWIVKKKKIDEGGEAQKQLKVKVKLLDERENAIRIKFKEHDLWFPKTTVNNTEFPMIDDEFELEVPEWLFEKKIEEEGEERTGKRVVSKPKEEVSDESETSDDSVEDDIPF